MKTRITTDLVGRVTISYDRINNYAGYENMRIQRTFSTDGVNGGYVIEIDHYGTHQICQQLNYSGHTLYCDNRADLPKIIRREYRAMRRAEKRAENGL